MATERRIYTPEFKAKVVREMKEGKIPRQDVFRKYGMGESSVAYNWLRAAEGKPPYWSSKKKNGHNGNGKATGPATSKTEYDAQAKRNGDETAVDEAKHSIRTRRTMGSPTLDAIVFLRRANAHVIQEIQAGRLRDIDECHLYSWLALKTLEKAA